MPLSILYSIKLSHLLCFMRLPHYVRSFLGSKINITQTFTSAQLSIFGLDVHLLPQPETSAMSTLFLKELVHQGILQNNLKLLDIGCGDCRACTALSTHVELSYTGIDYGNSNDFRSLTPVNHSAVKSFVIVETLLSNFKPDSSFDVIICSHFLEHQPCISSTLLTICKLASPGSFILFEFPLPHKRMIGGHTTLLTPALLAYNLALLGVSCIRSIAHTHSSYGILGFFYNPDESNDLSLSYRNSLIFDVGELEQVSHLLPSCIEEGSNMLMSWNTLHGDRI